MVGPYGRGTCLRRVYSYRNERIRVNNPQPLVDNRKSLSEPSEPSSTQTCYLLARLPYEVRIQIWTHALAKKTLHLELLPGRLGSRICEGHPERDARCHAIWHCDNCQDDSPMHERKSAVSLLQTCQQTYNETIDLLYAANTIDITDLGVMKYFVQGVPPKRLALIRDLRVHWQDLSWSYRWPTPSSDFTGTWDMFWRIALTELKGLRTITIMICSTVLENRIPEEVSDGQHHLPKIRGWCFWWEPDMTSCCRFVRGKKEELTS